MKIPHATGQLSVCAAPTEAQMPRAHAPQPVKPPQWEACAPQRESRPLFAAIREKLVPNNEHPAQPKTKQ